MMKKNMTTSICHCGVGEFRIKEFSLIKENSLLKFSCSERLQGTWNNDEMNFKVHFMKAHGEPYKKTFI
jgi:hypothetical protein